MAANNSFKAAQPDRTRIHSHSQSSALPSLSYFDSTGNHYWHLEPEARVEPSRLSTSHSKEDYRSYPGHCDERISSRSLLFSDECSELHDLKNRKNDPAYETWSFLKDPSRESAPCEEELTSPVSDQVASTFRALRRVRDSISLETRISYHLFIASIIEPHCRRSQTLIPELRLSSEVDRLSSYESFGSEVCWTLTPPLVRCFSNSSSTVLSLPLERPQSSISNRQIQSPVCAPRSQNSSPLQFSSKVPIPQILPLLPQQVLPRPVRPSRSSSSSPFRVSRKLPPPSNSWRQTSPLPTPLLQSSSSSPSEASTTDFLPCFSPQQTALHHDRGFSNDLRSAFVWKLEPELNKLGVLRHQTSDSSVTSSQASSSRSCGLGNFENSSEWYLVVGALINHTTRHFPDLCHSLESYYYQVMATSDVDKKFLGRFGTNLSYDNPELSKRLFTVSGSLSMLSPRVIEARRNRRLDTTRHTPSMQLYHIIIWYAKEILELIEHYLIPMTVGFTELKVLVLKLKASCYHLFVLFNNSPAVSFKGHIITTPPGLKPPHTRVDKGKGVDRGSPSEPDRPSSVQPTHPLEGGPVGGRSPLPIPGASDFLLPTQDFRPKALACFQQAVAAADSLLWGSHPLRLSVKVEYAAFLYDCLHEHDRSRHLSKATIAEVYNAQEGMDDDMFEDAAQLVSILGRMMKRGLSSAPGSTTGAASSGNRTMSPAHAVNPQVSGPSPGMF